MAYFDVFYLVEPTGIYGSYIAIEADTKEEAGALVPQLLTRHSPYIPSDINIVNVQLSDQRIQT